MSNDAAEEKISRTMSKYLRHNLKVFPGLIEGGWVPISELLTLKEFKRVSREDIERVVRNNNKQRFAIDGNFIRANQGHSEGLVEASALLTKILEPLPYCVHGTYDDAAALIRTTGLNKMSRDMIHFAESENAISGMRRSATVLVVVDMATAMRDGIEFFRSENDVILSPGINGVIPPQYLTIRNRI